jgi:hypothetical protein
VICSLFFAGKDKLRTSETNVNSFLSQPEFFHDGYDISLATGLVAGVILQEAPVSQAQMNQKVAIVGAKIMLADGTGAAARR